VRVPAGGSERPGAVRNEVRICIQLCEGECGCLAVVERERETRLSRETKDQLGRLLVHSRVDPGAGLLGDGKKRQVIVNRSGRRRTQDSLIWGSGEFVLNMYLRGRGETVSATVIGSTKVDRVGGSATQSRLVVAARRANCWRRPSCAHANDVSERDSKKTDPQGGPYRAQRRQTRKIDQMKSHNMKHKLAQGGFPKKTQVQFCGWC
jgi:hypothetical protein